MEPQLPTRTPKVAARSEGAPSLHAGLLRLNVVAAVVVALVLLAGLAVARLALRAIEADAAERRVEQARAFLARQAVVRRNRIEEFAYWDELWERAAHPGMPGTPKFLKENYTDWFPVRHGDHLLRMWGVNDRVMLNWTDRTEPGLEFPLSVAMRHNLEIERKTLAGFLWTGNRLLLFSGAPILPADYQRPNAVANGYVVAAAHVHDSTTRQWSQELQSRLVMLPPESALTLPALGTFSRTTRDSTESRFVLADPFGHPAAVVSLTASRAFFQDVARSLSWAFILSLGVGAAALLALWRRTERLVTRPLESIVEALGGMQRGARLSTIQAPAPAEEWALFVSAFNATVEALHDSEDRYRALFEQAPDALFLLDGARRIVDVNPAAEALAERGRDEMVGHVLCDVVPLEDRGVERGVTRVTRADGTSRMVGIVTGPAAVAGTDAGTLLSVRDLSERESMKGQLRAAHGQKMEAIGALAGGVAHDFNNLLGAILMSAAELRAGVAGPELKDAVETVEQAARRASELTRQLLRFARRGAVDAEPVDMGDVVTNVVRLCRRTLGPSIGIESAVAADVPVVMGEEGQLEQAILNLCINARDAMPGGGTLRLEVGSVALNAEQARELDGAEPGTYTVVSVTDSGTGMTPEVQRRVYEPFFTTKPSGKGTGLGLAMVYGAVHAHAGAIGLVSAPGRGTTFHLYLPASTRQVAVRAARKAGPLVGGSETILLIDDEDTFRRAVGRTLAKLGYAVLEAADGKAGLSLFEADPARVDLVIVDMAMPGLGGPEVFAAIHRVRADVPVLVCSGYPDGEGIRALIEAGACGVLPKPFDLSALATTVRAAVDPHRTREIIAS